MAASSSNKSSKTQEEKDRDFLLHLEAYLSKRDGVDKLLKISRYATKIILSSSSTSSSFLSLSLLARLKSFESSVGASRKAFRLGKFIQDLNTLRLSSSKSLSPTDRALTLIAYGGEGVYYFVEQFVWLVKAGLIPKEYGGRIQKISAWAELIGYVGSVALKVGEVRRIMSGLESRKGEEGDDEEETRKLREKLLMKEMSIVQDIADALMALADVRDGKGHFTGPLLMALVGLLSAIISTHKNWRSC